MRCFVRTHGAMERTVKTINYYLVCSLLALSMPASATTLDEFGPPPAGDPSAFTGPIIDENLADDLVNQTPVYKGALEGSPSETAYDQGISGYLSEVAQKGLSLHQERNADVLGKGGALSPRPLSRGNLPEV